MQAKVTKADVVTAASRILGVATRTPLLRHDALDAATGGRVFLKPECLQRTGSFKFRGAYNRLSAMTPEERKGGVVAYSSGNHAQGVALAAKLLGMPAVIVMPSDAPAIKVAATRSHGAEVVLYERLTQSREEIGGRIASDRGATVVPPFADPYVIAGQGTAGLEAAEDLAAMGLTVDLAVSPCGGGGLASGISLGLDAPVVPVEPEGYDDVVRSLAAGEILPVPNPGPTICDALQTLVSSPITFGILSERAAPGAVMTEAQVLRAMRFAFDHLKLVVEPGGSIALAAVLAGAVDLKDKTAVVLLSGGNVDSATFQRALTL